MIYTLKVEGKPPIEFKSEGGAKVSYARSDTNNERPEARIHQKSERGDCFACIWIRDAGSDKWQRNPALG